MRYCKVYAAAVLLFLVATSLSARSGKSFRFIQFTDPQFGFMDNAGKCSLQPESRQMDKVVDIIHQMRPPFAICTGDFIHLTGNDSATAVYNDYIARLRKDTRVYMVPGNHDLPHLDAKTVDYYARHFGDDRFAFKYKGCALIGLNSSIMQIGTPEEEAAHYAWLEAQLEKLKRCKTKLVFMHIPFAIQDIDEKEEYFNQPKPIRKKYLDLLERYGVQAVFCGHLHRNAYVKYHDIEIVTSNAVGRDLTGEDRHGMTLIEVTPAGCKHRYIELDDFLKGNYE